MKIKSGQTLLFIGDSITDCGRARPVGMRNGLGDGYVQLVRSLFSVNHPEVTIRFLNTGISGNRITDLKERWQTDVFDLQPDWLSIMIGINDVWRQFDNPGDPNPVTLDLYEKIYRELLTETQSRLKGLVLMTPFFIELNRNDPMRAKMDEYGQVVKRLASEYDAVFVDTQAAFDRYLSVCPSQTLCADRVHPNQAGHLILAKAFFTALGGKWVD